MFGAVRWSWDTFQKNAVIEVHRRCKCAGKQDAIIELKNNVLLQNK